MLNEIIRPFTSKWHPLSEAHLVRKPLKRGVAEWETTQWGGAGGPLHVAFRQELGDVRDKLRQCVFLFARVAGTEEFGSLVEEDASRSGGPGGWVLADSSEPPSDLKKLTKGVRKHMTGDRVQLTNCVRPYAVRGTFRLANVHDARAIDEAAGEMPPLPTPATQS